MYQFKQILKMDVTNLVINPMWWAGTIGLPLLLALILGFITSGSYGGVVTAYDYYGVGLLIFGALNNATLAANSFMESRILKANMRLCTAPVPAFSIYFPKALASFLFGLLCNTLAAVALHFIAGVRYGGGRALFLWLLLAAVDLFACCLGILLCCLLKNEEAVNQLLSNLVTISCLLGGVFFPLKGLGRVVGWISNVSPVTWISSAAFGAIYDDRLLPLAVVCVVLVALAALCIVGCAKTFNREAYV